MNAETTAAVGRARIRLVEGDLTEARVDAIVNAANSSLLGGGGVDGAIHRAGGPEILAECRRIRAAHGPCSAGSAVHTGGGRLPARYVIHAVGPIWSGGDAGEDEVLASAYRSCLAIAESLGVVTLAFPSISTGAYGYPEPSAARVALGTVIRHLSRPSGLEEVRFVLFAASTLTRYAEALDELLPPEGR